MQPPFEITRSFYDLMKAEITAGNTWLTSDQQRQLQNSRPLIHDPGRYMPEYVAYLYCIRRVSAVASILEQTDPMVLDAGSGYGSDSMLFASLGARVLAVNVSEAELTLAQKRQTYFEKFSGRRFDITYIQADLNTFTPPMANFSLTWLSSVLAIILDQDAFIQKIFHATRPGGQIIITDYNLLHPPFFMAEWLRRRKAMKSCPAFAREADYLSMVRRKGRKGARFFPGNNGVFFDDVQFFTPYSLRKVLKEVGFMGVHLQFSGFLPIPLFPIRTLCQEFIFCKIPMIRVLGRAYVAEGSR